jgi:NAD(P)-dependent dehydrogenase (short-subunit alcohol dehydrogenase family)
METPMSIFDLTGRVAIITGGNGGIGLGIAQALAAAGCNVSIWGRNAEKNRNAAATMAGCSGKVHTGVCDVSDSASVKSAMAATLERFGRVDGCFANAGIGGGGRHAFIDRTEEQWRIMFATNLDGVFHVFQAAARHMTERATSGDPFGRLVATSSLASRHRAQRTLRRDQGRHQRAGPRTRGRTGASGRHRQRHPARLDQKRHDSQLHGQ